MPTPHVDAVCTALRSPWFFGESVARTTAATQGRVYAETIRDRFNRRTDQAAIESGLALGAYAVHSVANKQQRMALRAVMLANVLMKGNPATSLPNIKERYRSLPLDALKRAFISYFPIHVDPNRAQWNPANFTDPAR